MKKTRVSWSARKSKGRVLSLEMMSKEKDMGDELYSKREGGTYSTVMGLRLFLHMERRFLFSSLRNESCVCRRKRVENE
jgi:hypothetical protein